MPDRDALLIKLEYAKLELKYAGPMHRRDLVKHIRRLEKQLRMLNKIESGKSRRCS